MGGSEVYPPGLEYIIAYGDCQNSAFISIMGASNVTGSSPSAKISNRAEPPADLGWATI